MDEFRWIIMSSFLMLVFKFTAATEKYSLAGNEVTLSCENVIDDQDKCDRTWIFSHSGKTVKLFEHGQIHKEAKDKSDRLRVTANCSLVIKKVTVEDAGFYACRQVRSGQDSQIHLSVITMTEQKDDDEVTLKCSVLTNRWHHRPTVEWLYEGKNVDEDNKDMKTSQSDCSATVTFLPSFLKQKSKYHELFKCKVTDGYTQEVHLFTFSLQSSGDDETTTTTTSPTTIKSPSTTRDKWTSETNNTESTNNNNQTKQVWWWFIIVFVGLVALLISVVAVIRWKRTKGNKTQVDENMGLSFNTAMAQSGPGTSQDTADPEDGVSYASISYTKKTSCKAWVRGDDDDDEGDAVIYSTVKASSSSAGASADPSSLYVTINN